MKTTKRVLAIVLAALMLACMIPFAVSAATTPVKTFDLTLTCDRPNYTFTIYQLATLDFDGNTCKGTYTIGSVSDAIKNDLKLMNETVSGKTYDSAQLLKDCDAAYKAGTGYGTAVSGGEYVTGTATEDNKEVAAAKTFTKSGLAAGIYYVACTDASSKNTSITNSVFALPYYKNNDWVNYIDATNNTNTIPVGTKVADDEPTAEKTVRDSYMDGSTKKWHEWAESISESIDKEFQFRIVTKVVGSATQKVNAYRVVDSQPAGITFDKVDVDSVKTLQSDKATVVDDAVAHTVAKTNLPANATFAVNITNVDDLYAENVAYVEVIYTAKLNANAVVAGNGNINKARLEWQPNGKTTWDATPDDEAKVFTYDVTIEKVDNVDNTKKLSGAVFEIYDNAACTGTALATATTGSNGQAKFVNGTTEYKFKEGTYYFKETVAPTGYNLSSEIHSVTINSSTSSTTANYTMVTITNSKSVLPQTGGEGTMVFTIIGISLILAAGVLFVIVMRKRASK